VGRAERVAARAAVLRARGRALAVVRIAERVAAFAEAVAGDRIDGRASISSAGVLEQVHEAGLVAFLRGPARHIALFKGMEASDRQLTARDEETDHEQEQNVTQALHTGLLLSRTGVF
jgi:hypothetical protein